MDALLKLGSQYAGKKALSNYETYASRAKKPCRRKNGFLGKGHWQPVMYPAALRTQPNIQHK